jgi:penicillin-binding protein 2
MINIATTANPDDKIQTGTYERREVIEAVRGEIYDRNGKKLIYNEYSYDLVFDYDAMAATQAQRNESILQIIKALEATDNMSHTAQESFPFDGVYPNYTYSVEIKDTDSNVYYRLLKRIAQNELEDESDKPKNELTVSYLADFYSKNPDKFPTEQEIVDFYLKKYKIVSDDKQTSFSNAEIDKILRMRYDMEVNDFSIYNRYTVATDIDMSSIAYIKELSVAGADFSIRASRVYAYPGYASHILGQTGKIPAENWSYYSSLGYEMNDVVGISGCEQIFEQYLRGQDGVRVVVEDKNGNIIDSRIEKEAVAGNDVYLTVDIDLQIAAEDGIKTNISFIEGTEAGAITAVDPNSGEVLALASYPTYDLSTYNENYNALISNPANPLLNRALNGTYAPGSTFKVGMVAAGISNGTLTSSTRIFCGGQYTYYSDYQPKCWVYPGAHYEVNAAYSLQVSCNCYFYELGRVMGIEKMNEYCRAYGLGEYTGIELGEKKGILAGPDYRDENGLAGWTAGNTISAAIGQSDNAFTPLQLSCYISTVLNGGTRYSARLLYQVKEYGTGNIVFKPESEVLNTVELTDDAMYAVRQGMKQMIANSSTASYYMRNVPVTVGGKTGTAQLGGGKKDNGVFVCAAPYNDPDIVISVVIEAAGGGSEASYSAASVLEEFYN